MNAYDLQVHPAAQLFPQMSDEEFVALKASIDEQGQIVPIELLDGLILDGRQRYRACQELGIDCKEVKLDDIEDPVAHVVTLNIQRRHLSSGQRAAIAIGATKLRARYEAEAAERRKRKRVDRSAPQVPGERDQSKHAGEAKQKLAKEFGTNRTFIDMADDLAREAPDLLEKVRNGELSLTAATSVVEERQTSDFESGTPIMPYSEDSETHITVTPVVAQVESSGPHITVTPVIGQIVNPEALIERPPTPVLAHPDVAPDACTEQAFVKAARQVLADEGDLDLSDTSCSNESVNHRHYYASEGEGFVFNSGGGVWAIMPEGNGQAKFVDKMLSHFHSGDLSAVVMLVSADTHMKWFARLAKEAAGICFITRVDCLHSGDRPEDRLLERHAVVYLGTRSDLFFASFKKFGWMAIPAYGSVSGESVALDDDAARHSAGAGVVAV